MSPRAHPNWLLFNVTRFNPFYALVEARIRALGPQASRRGGFWAAGPAQKRTQLGTDVTV